MIDSVTEMTTSHHHTVKRYHNSNQTPAETLSCMRSLSEYDLSHVGRQWHTSHGYVYTTVCLKNRTATLIWH